MVVVRSIGETTVYYGNVAGLPAYDSYMGLGAFLRWVDKPTTKLVERGAAPTLVEAMAEVLA